MAADNVAHMLYTKATTEVCAQAAKDAQDNSVLYTSNASTQPIYTISPIACTARPDKRARTKLCYL
eukprot:15057288-Heterocapsa_arctica.AAC.1